MSVTQPVPMVSVDQPRHRRVGEDHEAARRHAIGLVAELLRPHLVEVLEDIGLEQFAVHLATPFTAKLPTTARCAMRT
jgi:hypothetical protein